VLAAAILVAGTATAHAQTAPGPPPLLAGLLKAHASWRLLDPSRDPLGDLTQASLEELGHWPPWIVGDFDRDGRQDAAAVVVTAGRGRGRFGVVAVHARWPNRPIWIVPVGDQPYLAAYLGQSPDIVYAAHCLQCDFAEWYRWNGRTYEAFLYAVGEKVTVGEELVTKQPYVGRRFRLFERPDDGARRTTPIVPCTSGRVRRVVGRPDARWYLVDLDGDTPMSGWAPQRYLTEAVDCAG
jgi:hypothetical protein